MRCEPPTTSYGTPLANPINNYGASGYDNGYNQGHDHGGHDHGDHQEVKNNINVDYIEFGKIFQQN